MILLSVCYVLAMHDADTLTAHCEKRKRDLVIRVAEIDAPEFKAFGWGHQPGRTAALAEALRTCPIGKPMQLRLWTYDTRTKRWVAYVRCNGIDLSHNLAATGNAWAYYVAKGSTIPALVDNAKKNGVNIWAQPNPIAPTLWRSGKMHQPDGANLP